MFTQGDKLLSANEVVDEYNKLLGQYNELADEYNALVRNYNECNGDMFAIPKHFCDVAFLNMRLVKEYEKKLQEELYIS